MAVWRRKAEAKPLAGAIGCGCLCGFVFAGPMLVTKLLLVLLRPTCCTSAVLDVTTFLFGVPSRTSDQKIDSIFVPRCSDLRVVFCRAPVSAMPRQYRAKTKQRSGPHYARLIIFDPMMVINIMLRTHCKPLMKRIKLSSLNAHRLMPGRHKAMRNYKPLLMDWRCGLNI